MSKRFVDLHVHTNFSDGTFSPAEVISYASENKICAIAITDHDCIDGILPAFEASKNYEIEVIPGVELTAEKDNIEIHILGLLIDWQIEWFNTRLKEIRKDRVLRMKKMIEKLKARGIVLNEEDVFALSSFDGAIGRLHLARVLLEKGVIGSIQEAFERFIGDNKPCYEKRLRISPEEAIGMIKKIKGIPILAHPGTMGQDALIPGLARQGLMGIEIYHADHNKNTTHHYRNLAKKYKLLTSGGSDCHGMGKGYPLLGTVEVPYEILEELKQAQKREYTDLF